MTKSTLQDGRQWHKHCHWIFYFYFFTPRDSSGGLHPPATCIDGRTFFYIFQAECFKKWKALNK